MTRPIVEVEGLTKRFAVGGGLLQKPRPLHAVDGVDLHVNEGQTFAIVGESGCGKSTLARLLMRLLEPSEGRIGVAGRDISDLAGADLRALRRDVQFIFQDPFSSLNPRARVSRILTEGLIAYGTGRAQAMERARELLGLVGLDPSAMHRFPHEFSGGQRQRLAIARAFLKNAPLLILDEATSALDNQAESHIQKAMEEVMKGRTTIVIAHRLSTIESADQIVVMEEGRILERGSHADLLALGQRYAQLYNRNFEEDSEA